MVHSHLISKFILKNISFYTLRIHASLLFTIFQGGRGWDFGIEFAAVDTSLIYLMYHGLNYAMTMLIVENIILSVCLLIVTYH